MRLRATSTRAVHVDVSAQVGAWYSYSSMLLTTDGNAKDLHACTELASLQALGEGDAARGIESVTKTLLDEMVARQLVLDEVRADIHTRRNAARMHHDRTRGEITQQRSDALASAEAVRVRTLESAEERASSRFARANDERSTKLEELETTHAAHLTELQLQRTEALVMAEAVYEAGEEAERRRMKEIFDALNESMRVAKELEAAARAHLRSCRLTVPSADGSTATMPEGVQPRDEIELRITAAQHHLNAVLGNAATKLLQGSAPVILAPTLIIAGTVAGAVASLLTADQLRPAWFYPAIGGGTAAMLVAIVFLLLRSIAMRALTAVWSPFQDDLAVLRAMKTRAEVDLRDARDAKIFLYRTERAAEVRATHLKFDGPIDELPKSLARRSLRADTAAKNEIQQSNDERMATLARAAQEFASVSSAIVAAADLAAKEEVDRAHAQTEALAAEEEARLHAARAHWLRCAAECRDALQFAQDKDAELHPSWDELDPATDGVASWRAPWFRFGSLTLDPRAVPGGLPDAPDFFVEMPKQFNVPAALGFPLRGNLVIETTPELRADAIRAVQALVARLVISIPPSKARFTFIDPVGLGESFAAFMHLGDEFEQLVGERIWTDPRAIEQRLIDISEHMETVIQKYLRNEFEDIDAYNDAAGEIAEPYRFLVCADFPANFSEQAAARLLSILRAGQRCGVHVILLRDSKSALPDGIDADELAASCITIVPCTVAKDVAGKSAATVPSNKRVAGTQAFRFSDGPFASLPLTLDTPLSDSKLVPLLARIGRVAKTAARVEVPFDAIAPKPDAFWSLSSAANLRVPVGRAGATRLQQFLLGEGTSQHALIAGKTGSGKSTLLHAIITGIATWYSPDEVELWLVDFKKGVEFKTYAEHKLPHARAVAIESDREFGLSILEGLDAELSRRGELYRDTGVQDLASFRRVRPDVRMPRVLLVIDEFQEFFLDDDKVSQGAAMFLDRLVRQGRAFGIHVILGSQTLGGAYSLARSTMGQMGVRIALQCSEADSQMILSDENLAARLLSRPGEAIYNDAGGRLEGNSPFQVAFLPDAKRDSWLEAVRTRDTEKYASLPRIIFEGDARASMSLHPAIKGGFAPDPRGAVRVWLGEAVAIKDPTCARLARASGANIAAISPRDDQALSTSLAMLLSIAAESPDSIIDVFDGTPADAPEYGALEAAARTHGLLATDRVRFVNYREIDARLIDVAQDVSERADESGRARRFLLVHQLQRYRSLRRNEDDFSFSGSEGPPSSDKLLAGIVREGPVAGVHVLVMCDTLASLQRAFDRNALREFDWKVLYQISPADSSTLIDSPAASRLGTNRGLLQSEELGLLEKYRPYAI